MAGWSGTTTVVTPQPVMAWRMARRLAVVGIGGADRGRDAAARTLKPGASGPARDGVIPGPPPPTIEQLIPSIACQAIEDWIPPRAAGYGSTTRWPPMRGAADANHRGTTTGRTVIGIL